MKLDVVVPTYNRSDLLRRTIASLFTAELPPGLEVTVLVVDNNSKDDTEQVVRHLQAEAPIPLQYVRETKQGLSHARNGGIAAGNGEIIGFIDDDEEIDTKWFTVIAREFSDPATQFIGGPYLANCEIPMPSWIPPGYNGVLGVIPPKPRTIMAPPFPGNLQGGNAVFRRTVFDRVGLYNVKLGRSGKGLLSEEDAELYRRLLDAGLLGFHVPDLAIYHYIPAERLTRRYFRKWCYWRGVSQGIADKTRKEPVSYLFGIPRYRLRQAVIGLAAAPANLLESGSGPSFAKELPLWDLLGFIYGKYFISIDSYYADKKG
ncbi:glycosyltransferase [Granulicella sp. dw_53]|uniref:glycosyltransferase n=1 Tax=Granulicella sp. dw_53 TaxID=2719792 RepID=UPI001BD4F8D4|nr:glycosyltransferase [Granulicella sp. dw_53]